MSLFISSLFIDSFFYFYSGKFTYSVTRVQTAKEYSAERIVKYLGLLREEFYARSRRLGEMSNMKFFDLDENATMRDLDNAPET